VLLWLLASRLFSQVRAAAEALHRLNRELRAISDCNQVLLRATDEQSLLDEICRIVCEEAGYRMAWVAYAEHDEAKSVRFAACTGAEEAYLANLGITWGETERSCGPTGTAIRSGKTCSIQDFATDSGLAPWRDNGLLRDFRSAIALPLKDEHANTFGCLSIYSAQPDAFTSDEVRLLEELAGDMAFGIVTLRSRAARKQAEEALRRSEAYLVEAQRLSHTGSWAFNPVTTKTRYWSDETFRIWGFDPQDGPPSQEQLFERIHPEDRATVKAISNKALSEKTDLDYEFRIVLPNGTLKHIHTTVHVVLDGSGDIVEFMGTNVDVTEPKRAGEALRESEANLNRAQEIAHIGSWHLDIARNRLTWSDEVFRIFGVPIGTALTYEAFLDRVHPADRESVHNAWSAALHGAPYDIEHRISVGRDVRWVREQAKLEFSKEGNATSGTGIVQDITERKRTEVERLQSAERFRAIADYTYDWENWVGVDGKLLWVNPAVERITGYSVDDCMAMPDFPIPIVAEADREVFAGQMREAVQGSTRNDFEFRVRHKDGHLAWVAASWQPIQDSRGAKLGYRSSIRDVAERKRAEEELRHSEAYLAEAERLSHTGSWAFDIASDRYVHVSEECLRVFGFDSQEVSPTREVVFRRIHPDDSESVKQGFEKSIHEKVDTSNEFRIVLPDGAVKTVRVTRHPVLNSDGDVVKLTGAAVDITERKRAEEALSRSESYLAEAQRLSHTGSWALDLASGNYVYFSEEYIRISGFDPQQGLPANDQPLQQIHPDDVDKFWQGYQKLIDEKVDSEGEYRIVLPDGTVKHVHTIRHPVLNAHGELVEVVGTTIDITERKRAEEALRRTAAYLTETQRLTHTGTFVADNTTKPLYWSEELFRIFGFDPQDGLPTRDQPLQRVHPEDLDKFWQAWQRVIQDKLDADVEYRIVLPDGTLKHAFGLGHPVLDANGELVEIVGTTIDITERKLAEEALRESETRFRTFVDHAGDALFVQDLEQGTIVDVNRSACDSLGYTREELIGTTPHAFHLDSERAEIDSVAQRAAAGETAFDRHWHRRKDGTTFPVEVHTNLVSYGGRRFLLKVARDISDRVRAEEQRDKLRQLEAELAHLDRLTMLGELTASIAHEVNQPLSGVVSNGSACLRWLAGDVPNLEEAREAARRIVRDGKRAGEVIARIRALTKKAPTPREKLDLNETLRQVLALIGDQARRNSIMIRTQFADDLSPISGDQVQLQQVALNLAMNAIDAMSNVSERARELVITTRNIDTDQVQVTVEDSGVGLNPNTMQKIFEPFYTTKSTGMGMGLSISRSILQSHGGRLWAAAKDGPGTTFCFTLPKYHEEESHAGVSAA
jgi:PAS domain S-box-containing protein